MEWFKHPTGSHEDPDISDAWDRFGPNGVVIFWTILEIYGKEFNHLNDQKLTLSWKYLQRKLRTKRKTTENVMSFYRERNRIFSEWDQASITFKIPKFIELASNWSRRAHAEKKGGPTEAPTAIEVEEDIEVEEEKKRKNIYREPAKRIINHLNIISGRNFRHGEENLQPIIARLKSGFTEEQCKKVIEIKWDDPEFNQKFFRPVTLFRASLFEGYLHQEFAGHEKMPENDNTFKQYWFGNMCRWVKEYSETQNVGAKEEIIKFAKKYGSQSISKLIGENQCKKYQYPEQFNFLSGGK